MQQKHSKLSITPESITLLKTFVDQGILEPLSAHLLPEGTGDGTIAITCSDGDQMADLFSQHHDKCGERCHLFSFNGGGLWLSPLIDSERAEQRRDLIKNDLPEAISMKGISTVVIYGHAPCGVALSVLNCNVDELISHLVRAKMELKKQYSGKGLKFVCALHVDWGNGKKDTYWVNAKKWRELKGIE